LFVGPLHIVAKTYKATDEETIKLNQIHKCADVVENGKVIAEGTYNQLQQGSMTCIACQAKVERADVKSGYKHNDQFFLVTEEEKKAQMVMSTEEIVVTEFVKSDAVDPIYFEDCEYLAPDKGGEKWMSLFRKSLMKTKCFAIAKRSQRGKEQTLIIRPLATGGLVLHHMFYEHEVRSFDKFVDVIVPQSELDILSAYIETETVPFTMEGRYDISKVNLKKLIASKIEGKEAPVVEKKKTPEASGDIMEQLKAAINKKKAAKA
jgi:DNA end-binding protein Ku